MLGLSNINDEEDRRLKRLRIETKKRRERIAQRKRQIENDRERNRAQALEMRRLKMAKYNPNHCFHSGDGENTPSTVPLHSERMMSERAESMNDRASAITMDTVASQKCDTRRQQRSMKRSEKRKPVPFNSDPFRAGLDEYLSDDSLKPNSQRDVLDDLDAFDTRVNRSRRIIPPKNRGKFFNSRYFGGRKVPSKGRESEQRSVSMVAEFESMQKQHYDLRNIGLTETNSKHPNFVDESKLMGREEEKEESESDQIQSSNLSYNSLFKQQRNLRKQTREKTSLMPKLGKESLYNLDSTENCTIPEKNQFGKARVRLRTTCSLPSRETTLPRFAQFYPSHWSDPNQERPEHTVAVLPSEEELDAVNLPPLTTRVLSTFRKKQKMQDSRQSQPNPGVRPQSPVSIASVPVWNESKISSLLKNPNRTVSETIDQRKQKRQPIQESSVFRKTGRAMIDDFFTSSRHSLSEQPSVSQREPVPISEGQSSKLSLLRKRKSESKVRPRWGQRQVPPKKVRCVAKDSSEETQLRNSLRLLDLKLERMRENKSSTQSTAGTGCATLGQLSSERNTPPVRSALPQAAKRPVKRAPLFRSRQRFGRFLRQ